MNNNTLNQIHQASSAPVSPALRGPQFFSSLRSRRFSPDRTGCGQYRTSIVHCSQMAAPAPPDPCHSSVRRTVSQTHVPSELGHWHRWPPWPLTLAQFDAPSALSRQKEAALTRWSLWWGHVANIAAPGLHQRPPQHIAEPLQKRNDRAVFWSLPEMSAHLPRWAATKWLTSSWVEIA